MVTVPFAVLLVSAVAAAAFIVKNGSTLEQFVAECDKAEQDSFALELIMGITSFDAFKQLMIDQKAKMSA